MNTSFLKALPLLTALSASIAHAADVTLSVSGEISPVSCSLDVSNGGTFNFGEFNYFLGHTVYPVNNYSVMCPGGARIALKFTDNREGTEISGGGPQAVTTRFGIGQDASGNNIGYNQYDVLLGLVDNDRGVFLHSSDDGQNWRASPDPFLADHQSTGLVSFGNLNDTSPATVESVTGSINAFLTLADASDLDLTQDVDIDGSATIELIYL